jgi:hypothetical protein
MAYSKKINDAKKAAKKEQAAAEKLARSAVEEKAKPSRKNAKPKPSKAKGEQVGALSKREAERSLWAPRVESKAKRAKKKTK